MAKTSAPVLRCTYTATFPRTRDAWLQEGDERIKNVDIAGGNHYPPGQPELVGRVADEMAGWMNGF